MYYEGFKLFHNAQTDFAGMNVRRKTNKNPIQSLSFVVQHFSFVHE